MKKLTLLSLVFLTFFACRNDIDETLSTEETTDQPITTEIDYTPEVIEVTATLFGTVLDENGAPVAGASVRLDNNTETTDEGGRFIFKDMTMNAAGTFVEANRNGYFPGSHRFFPQEGSVNYATITLLDKTNTGNFVSTDGGVITSPEGIKLDFPANSVVNSNNEVYEGTVDVYARWIDPSSDRLQEIMPGGLQGISTVLEEVALASFGMIAVEIESPSGQALNLGNDLNATLTFPVPDELLSTAPAEIPLWYFSDTYGIWVQEGTATLEGNEYVGEVAHFSFWNCDAPFPLVELTGTVLSGDGNPLQNAYVSITVVSSGASSCGWTDNAGVFGGKVPKDEELILTIYQTYGCDVYTSNIGPFSDDVDLGTITITAPELVDITGTIVDCAGDPVTNGWVEITLGDDTYTYYVSDDNNFSVSTYNCDGLTEFSLVAVNIDELIQSDEMTFSITDPVDIGEVAACDNALTEWIIITVDGTTTTTFLDVSIHLDTPDSSFIAGSVPGTDYNIYLGIDAISAPGTYPGTAIQYSNMFIPVPSGDAWLEIATFNELVIDDPLGAIGENVTGSFSGEGMFFDQNQQGITLPFTATFQIVR